MSNSLITPTAAISVIRDLATIAGKRIQSTTAYRQYTDETICIQLIDDSNNTLIVKIPPEWQDLPIVDLASKIVEKYPTFALQDPTQGVRERTIKAFNDALESLERLKASLTILKEAAESHV